MDRGAWRATVHGVARVGHDLVTKLPPCRLDCEIPPPADALHTHSALFLEGSSWGSPPLLDAPASPPQALRSQRQARRISQGSSSESSESSDSLAPVGASRSE